MSATEVLTVVDDLIAQNNSKMEKLRAENASLLAVKKEVEKKLAK